MPLYGIPLVRIDFGCGRELSEIETRKPSVNQSIVGAIPVAMSDRSKNTGIASDVSSPSAPTVDFGMRG